jgi:hypothetical protein
MGDLCSKKRAQRTQILESAINGINLLSCYVERDDLRCRSISQSEVNGPRIRQERWLFTRIVILIQLGDDNAIQKVARYAGYEYRGKRLAEKIQEAAISLRAVSVFQFLVVAEMARHFSIALFVSLDLP